MHINNMAAMVDLYIFITACTAILLYKRDKYQLYKEKQVFAKGDLDHEFEQRVGQQVAQRITRAEKTVDEMKKCRVLDRSKRATYLRWKPMNDERKGKVVGLLGIWS